MSAATTRDASHERQPYVRIDHTGPDVEIWLEPCEGDVELGLCLGTGTSLPLAVADANRAIADAARQLDHLLLGAASR